MSITVDAASYDDYQYILYDATSGYVWASNYPITVIVKGNTKKIAARSIGSSSGVAAIRLVYANDLQDWTTDSIGVISTDSPYYDVDLKDGSIDAGKVKQFIDTGISVSNAKIYTNVSWGTVGKGYVKSYSNDLTVLPHGLTESTVQDIINEQLNTITTSGQTAQTIINNTTNQYNRYLSGDINSETMQQNVKTNIDTLSDLTPSTLLDAMQINNGLTYNQTIQDQLLNTASGNVQTMINGYQNTINNAITNYQNGTTSQTDTVTTINQTITNLNNLIINGTAKTTADINAVNAAINSANANLDSVTGYKDLSQEVSEKVQQSDQEELDYLDELEAETTATIEQIAPSQNFTGGQTGDAQEVLDLVWENEFVKRLLPMCAGFMVVCVVLGIRYKV